MNILVWAPPWVGPTFLSVYLSWAHLMHKATSSFSCTFFDAIEGVRAWPQLTFQEGRATFSKESTLSSGLFLRQQSLVTYVSQQTTLATPLWIMVLPTMTGLIEVKKLLGQLSACGFPSSQIRFLLMELGAPHGLPKPFIEKEIGPLFESLPYDPVLSFKAEKEGRFLSELAPPSKVVRVLKKWAAVSLQDIKQRESVSKSHLSSMLLSKLESTMIDAIRKQPPKPDETPQTRIAGELNRVLSQEEIPFIPKEQRAKLEAKVYDHLFGLGPLEKAMRDPAVSEIMINGTGHPYIEREGKVEAWSHAPLSPSQVKSMIDRIVARAGRRVDQSSPLCDVRLADGSRANVVLPPVSLQGPLLTIRRFRKKSFSLSELMISGTLTSSHMEQLKALVRNRKNIVIAGNTGSGKTTLLNTLSQFIDPGERVITVEDTAELQLTQPHVLRLETRPKNLEGQGEISMKALVINALRMRPDRILVGECRGDEVIPMLQSMNTGHDGAMTTLHANSADDVMTRLESMILLAAPHWPLPVIRQQIITALDAVVYMKRHKGRRQLTDIRFFK